MAQSDLKNKIISGSFWTVFSNIASQLVTFTVTIVLARLLTPGDFGVVAISSVFVGVIILFQDLGMGAAIIQRQHIDDDYLSTSFTVSLLAGVLLAALLALSSSFIADFYNERILRDILLVSSLGFILSPFTSIHTTLLSKRLEFKKLSLINFGNHALSGLISVVLAFMGYGVWSMVLGKILSQPVVIPAVWRIVKWTPRPRIVKRCFLDLFGYSSNLLGFNLLNFFARNLDNLIIGKYLGTQPLGYYSVAYNLMLKPLQLISWSMGKVLFPLFSTIQNDLERTRAVYLTLLRSISLVTFPMMTGLFMVAEEFILSVYGTRWEPAILPLKLLCIVGAVQSIGTVGGIIFNSQGRPDLTLKIGIFSSSLIVVAFITGINWGLLGLIYAYIAVTVPVFLTGQYFANRLIGIRMLAIFKSLAPSAACSAVMVAALAGSKWMWTSLSLDIEYVLIALIMTGIATYLVFASRVLKVPEINEALKLVRRKV